MRRELASSLSFKFATWKRSLLDISMCTRYKSIYLLFFSNFSNSRLLILDWLNVLRFYRINIADRWKHIYRCHKSDLEKKHCFVELCFQCDEWIIAATKWFEHCQRHLNDLDTLSIQCNSLVFRRTLTIVEQYLFYLFDLKLSSTKRFHQFLIKQSWREYLQKHFWQLEYMYSRFMRTDESKTVSYSDSRCVLSFDSIQDLQCYCQNVYYIERVKLDSIKRRRRTSQSSLNVKTLLDVDVKLKYRCDLVKEKSSFENVNESINSSTLESIDVDVIVVTESMTLNERNSVTRRCSLSSIDTIAS